MQPTQPARLPTRAVLQPSGLFVALRDIAPAQLQDAFMIETTARSGGRDDIIEIPDSELGRLEPGGAPAGFIFQVARCGSTLVAQLLKQHADLVVYSEPQPINEILVPPHRQDRARIVAALRGSENPQVRDLAGAAGALLSGIAGSLTAAFFLSRTYIVVMYIPLGST